jgi:hypothetical protein
MPDKKTLDYYVAELRRVEQSRQADTEKKVKKIYRELKKDLNAFLANEYADYSNDKGELSVALLQEKARYAKFLQEVDQHLNSITPNVSKTIRATVEGTYKAAYTGMIDAVKQCANNTELNNKLQGLSLRPEVMKRAVENPISGLTLPDTLEKHRKEVIYDIKQQINIGLMTGERYDTMAKSVNKVLSGDNGTGGSYGKAMNIVRTEVHRVQESGFNDCAEDISDSLTDSGLIYTKTWRTMQDERVRPQHRIHTSKGWKTKISGKANHQKMEGVTVKVGDKFELEHGVFAECPGSSGTARNDCRCRCFLEYELMTVEEYAEATNKSVAEVKKELGIVDKPKEAKYEETKANNTENDVANNAGSGIMELKENAGATPDFIYKKMSREERKAVIERGQNEPLPTFSYDTEINKFPSMAKNIEKEKDCYDVVSHGNPNSIEFFKQDTTEGERNIDAYTLSAILKGRKDYREFLAAYKSKDDKPCIRLLACNTGNTDDSGDCFAQLLANELGIIVKAPTELLFVNSDYSYYVGSEKTIRDGRFEVFYPRR